MKKRYSLVALMCLYNLSLAEETIQIDPLSVTATKVERATKEVSQSIAVVNEKEIGEKNILFISEAINTIPGVIAQSSSNSSSPRLIIRGAGLKARYGVREIMVVKDGVPMTDPDSFTRFDFIDMQDVQAIEVQKGPGSIYAANATGGVIQLLTKSVFSQDYNRIKFGFGNDQRAQGNFKYSTKWGENDYFSTTMSLTQNDNYWRDNNEVKSKQISLKYGHIFDDDATLQTELAYTKSDVQLPTSMTPEEFNKFKKSGKQEDTSSAWQKNARNSKILFFNAKYEKELGDFMLKPRVYFNTWEHFHPVTAMINDSDDNDVFGTDLEANYSHRLFENEATLVFGVTAKQDRSNDSKKYTYDDFTIVGGGKFNIDKVLSDKKGDLANTEDATSTLYGAYIQESLKPTQNSILDLSLRVDKVKFDVDGNELLEYNWSGFGGQTYTTGDGKYNIDESYTLVSPKIGYSYAITPYINVYASVASANQAPTDNELKTNRVEDKESLEKTRSTNYEMGVKARGSNYSMDLALYQNDVKDEITATKQGFTTFYQNAGKTQKRGLELTGTYYFNETFSLGASYAYSHYKFKEFMEEGTQDRRDNFLPYIPKHKYALFASMKFPMGFKARVESRSSGSYYMDNANTEKYEGYKFVTDVMLGYEKNNHSLQLNVQNLFDKRYAMEAQKDIDGDKTYKAGTPRSIMLTYAYKF
jgi:iron complex outermembrane receptor protein